MAMAVLVAAFWWLLDSVMYFPVCSSFSRKSRRVIARFVGQGFDPFIISRRRHE